MTRLPPVHTQDPAPGERKRLALWLHEREIEQALSGDEPEHPSTPRPMENANPDPLAPGQIRLLYPSVQSTAVRPRYVALHLRKGSNWLVIPFGRYGTPALPGEWQTSRETTHLRVLCAWNAFEMPHGRLAESWRVDALDNEERKAIATLLPTTDNSATTPFTMQDRTGPSLTHPLDPRREYLDEERLWTATISAKTLTYTCLRRTEYLPLAAEEQANYGTESQDSGGSSDHSGHSE